MSPMRFPRHVLVCAALGLAALVAPSFAKDREATPASTPRIIRSNGTLYLADPALLRERPPEITPPRAVSDASNNPQPRAATPRSLQNSGSRANPTSPSLRSSPGNSQKTPQRTAQSDPALPRPYFPQSKQASSPTLPVSTNHSSQTQRRPARIAETRRRPQTILRVGTDIPFPTEYAPPQIAVNGQSVAVAPATPTRFAVAETGVRFNGTRFSSTEFAGFINYGSPIYVIAQERSPDGSTVQPRAITVPNPILQPVFRRIEFTTR